MFIETSNYYLADMVTLASSLLLVLGHNLWLVGKKVTESSIKIEINTGDDFPSGETAISPQRIAQFKAISENSEQKILDFKIEGTSLTAIIDEKPQTAFISTIELLPHPITLEADRFAHYIKDEDAQDFTAPDFVIGETTAPQRESYAKFAKVLVRNDGENVEIFTAQTGQRLEIILTETPKSYPHKLPVQVLFEGKPIQNLRVSSGAENLNGGRYSAHTRTDKNGLADIEITQNGQWFIRTHLIRRHSDSANFEWESFWASVTFHV